MATAVEPNSAPSTPGKALGLPVASLLGAIYILAALAVAFFAVPALWTQLFGPDAPGSGFNPWRVAAQLAALIGVLGFGLVIVGDTALKGVRGGSFLMAVTVILVLFIARAFAMNIEGASGKIVGAVVAAGLIYIAVRFFIGRSGERWMVALDEQGWFSAAQYKRSLGVRIRRFTILGILIVGGTGAYAIRPATGLLPENWTLSMPFDGKSVTLLTDAQLLVPLLIFLATLWVAFRAVNLPDFAEFLIATEAEMNKVSWSTRKRLAQDTVVVLTTTLIMTLFLLVVDLFWGWLLSRQTVGVLPSRATSVQKGQEAQEQKW
jgi:preprotein translocase SecE subunit